MKYILSLCLLMSCPFAFASEPELSGPEALALFHRSVFQTKNDLKAFLQTGRVEIAKIQKSSSLKSMCLKGQDSKKCELAIQEAFPFSVFVVRDPKIFQLDHDLKTKYQLDFESGLKAFQLSTGLRWLARKDVYNGVVVPKEANRKTYTRFLAAIEEFHKNKSIDLRKGEPMIPPPPKKSHLVEVQGALELMTDDELAD